MYALFCARFKSHFCKKWNYQCPFFQQKLWITNCNRMNKAQHKKIVCKLQHNISKRLKCYILNITSPFWSQIYSIKNVRKVLLSRNCSFSAFCLDWGAHSSTLLILINVGVFNLMIVIRKTYNVMSMINQTVNANNINIKPA